MKAPPCPAFLFDEPADLIEACEGVVEGIAQVQNFAFTTDWIAWQRYYGTEEAGQLGHISTTRTAK